MILTLNGYFDIGFSIGINDQAFSSIINNNNDYIINFHNEVVPVGINIEIGNGILVDLTNNNISNLWQKEAKLKAISLFNDVELESYINSSTINSFTIELFALGIVFIKLDIVNVPKNAVNNIEHFYQCYEYAGYEKVSETLIQIVKSIINPYKSLNNLSIISKRFEIDEIVPFDLIPGFVCVCVCQKDDNTDLLIKKLQEYERQYTFSVLDLDEAIVHLGWATTIIEPRDVDIQRVFFLIKIAQLYFAICEAFEKLFSKHMINTVRISFGESNQYYNAQILNKLRTLAMSVNQVTNFSSTSNNISDLFFFKEFEKLGNINNKHDRIQSTCDIFANIHTELAEIAEIRREKKLSNFIFILTSLTFISVTADIIGTVDYVHTILPNPLFRFLVLTIPTFTIIFFIWRRIQHKNYKK
jgi:uncharacterized protein YfbU (UPF0304 family)